MLPHLRSLRLPGAVPTAIRPRNEAARVSKAKEWLELAVYVLKVHRDNHALEPVSKGLQLGYKGSYGVEQQTSAVNEAFAP